MKSTLSPVEKVRVPEQIAEILLKHILRGKVNPGDKLPPERLLASQLHVTRATLREALKKLEQLKLIAIHQGKGIIVEDFHRASLDLIFSLLVIDGRIDLKILENILDARELFGTDVARCAARRADPKDIRQMKQLMENSPRPLILPCFNSWISNFPSTGAGQQKHGLYPSDEHDPNDPRQASQPFLPLSANPDTTLQQEILQAVIDQDEETAAAKTRKFLHAESEFLKFLKSGKTGGKNASR